jgi:hypothetical protein
MDQGVFRRGVSEQAVGADPSPESGTVSPLTRPPAWKSLAGNSHFQRLNEEGIRAEQTRVRQSQQDSPRASSTRQPKWKSGIGILQREFPDGSVEDHDPETLLDDPEVGQMAAQSLYLRDVKAAQDDEAATRLRLDDPNDQRKLADKKREEILSMGSGLAETDPEHQRLKKQLVDHDARIQEEQDLYQKRVRLQQIKQGGVSGWLQQRQQAKPIEQKAQEASQQAQANTARIIAAEESAALEEEQLSQQAQQGVRGNDLPAFQQRQQELAAAKTQIAQQKAQPDAQLQQVATEAAGKAEVMDGKPKLPKAESLAAALQSAKLYGSATAAMGNSSDQGIRRGANGNWDLPLMMQQQDNPIINVIGNLAVTGGQKLGARLESGGVQKDAIQSVFHKFQQDNNLSDEEVATAWSDLGAQSRKWDTEEKTRVLSDGRILLNPLSSYILDTKQAEAVIDESSATPEQKAYAKTTIQGVQNNVAAGKLEAYEAAAQMLNSKEGQSTLSVGIGSGGGRSGLKSPSEWASETGRKDTITAKFIADYEREVIDKQSGPTKWARGIATDWMMGNLQNANMVLGLGGMAGSETMAEMAAQGAEASNLIGQGKADTGITGQIVQQVPQMAAQIVTGRLLGGAAAITGKAAPTIANIGTVSMAGAQSAGMTYAQQRAAGDTHEVAFDKAYKSGVSTAVITGIMQKMGAGGVEKVAAGRSVADVTVRDLLKSATKKELLENTRRFAADVIKASGGEFTEEFADQLAQSFLTADPDTNLANAWEEAVQAGTVGGIMGGGTKVLEASFDNHPQTPDAQAARVTAETLKTDPTAAPVTPEEIRASQDVVGDYLTPGETPDEAAARVADGVKIHREISQFEEQAASAVSDALAALDEATATGDKVAIEAAKQNLDKASAEATKPPRARAVAKIARGESLDLLTHTELQSLGIQRTGKPSDAKTLEAQGLTAPLVDIGPDGRPILLDEAIKQAGTVSPTAAARVKQTETEARKAAAVRASKPWTVTGAAGTSVKVQAKTREEAERMAVGMPQWKLGETVKTAIEGANSQSTPNSSQVSSLEPVVVNETPVAEQQAPLPVTDAPQATDPATLKRKITKAIAERKKGTTIPIDIHDGLHATATEKGVRINPSRLADIAAKAGFSEDQAGEWVASVIDEEIRHVAHLRAARAVFEQAGSPGGNFDAWLISHYGQMWQGEFSAEQKSGIEALYGTGFENLKPHEKAMEGLRMLSQQIATGSPTESARLWKKLSQSIRDHITAALASLKAMTTSLSPVLKAEVDALEAFLSQYATQPPATPNRSEKPAPVKAPVRDGEAGKPSRKTDGDGGAVVGGRADLPSIGDRVRTASGVEGVYVAISDNKEQALIKTDAGNKLVPVGEVEVLRAPVDEASDAPKAEATAAIEREVPKDDNAPLELGIYTIDGVRFEWKQNSAGYRSINAVDPGFFPVSTTGYRSVMSGFNKDAQLTVSEYRKIAKESEKSVKEQFIREKKAILSALKSGRLEWISGLRQKFDFNKFKDAEITRWPVKLRDEMLSLTKQFLDAIDNGTIKPDGENKAFAAELKKAFTALMGTMAPAESAESAYEKAIRQSEEDRKAREDWMNSIARENTIEAISRRDDVPADRVDDFKLELPKGYKRRGKEYVWVGEDAIDREQQQASLTTLPTRTLSFDEALEELAPGTDLADDPLPYYDSIEHDIWNGVDPESQKKTPIFKNDQLQGISNPQWMTPEEAEAKLAEWKAQAKADGANKDNQNSGKYVVSLFDSSGVWSQPWVDAGYTVIRFDLDEDSDSWKEDVQNLTREFMEDNGLDMVDIVLAQPPCTDFSLAGNRWFHDPAKAEQKKASLEKNTRLVDHTLDLIGYLRPLIWGLENPIGTIKKHTKVAEPRLVFDPFMYGADYTKRTQIFGTFNEQLPEAMVYPAQGSRIHKLSGSTKAGKTARSLTPEQFAYAFYMANRDYGQWSAKRAIAQEDAPDPVKQRDLFSPGNPESTSAKEISEAEVRTARVQSAIAEIEADIQSGTIPDTVRSFSELADYVDANEYVNDANREDRLIGPLGKRLGWKAQDFTEFTNIIIRDVDSWLASRSPAQPETSAPAISETTPKKKQKPRTIDTPARREAYRILDATDSRLASIAKIVGQRIEAPPAGMLRIIKNRSKSGRITENQRALLEKWKGFDAYMPKSAFGDDFNGKVAKEIHGMLFSQDRTNTKVDDWAKQLGDVTNDEAMILVMNELNQIARGQADKALNPNREWSEAEIAAEQGKLATPTQTAAFKDANEYDFGRNEVEVADLKVGDVVTIDREPMTVEAVEDDGTVILQDGSRFGRQVLESGETLYVEASEAIIEPEQIEAEAEWLVDASEEMGYESIDEHAATDPAGFEQIASEAEALGQGDSSTGVAGSSQKDSGEATGGEVAAEPVYFYVKGDRAEYTGEVRQVAGVPFHIGILREGARIGQEVGTYTPPGGTNPLQDQSAKDYRDQQEQFKRLKTPASKMDIRNADSKELFADDGGFKLGQDTTVDGDKVAADRKAKEDAKAAQDAAQGDMFGAPALTEAEQALKDAFGDMVDGLNAADLSDSAPTYSQGIPPEKIGQFIAAAQKLIAEGVKTPNGLAAALDKISPKLRAYSDAVWSAFRMVDPSLQASPDWAGVYSKINEPTSNDGNPGTPLESDRGNTVAGNPGGESGVSTGSAADRGDGGRVGEAGSGSRDGRSNRVQPDNVLADAGGAQRDSGVRESASESGQRLAGNESTRGSGRPDANGVEAFQRGENDTHDGLVIANSPEPVASSGVEGIRDAADIRKSAPALTIDQAGDVAFIEKRLLESGKTGVLLTNGTGTGKTFSGLGAIKRALDRGEKHIIIVAPSDKIGSDWAAAAKKHFGIQDIAQLNDTKDRGDGNRVVVTTYANFGQNNELVSRPWGMVVTDEAHYLSSSKDGSPTLALATLRGLTWHPTEGVRSRLAMEMADEFAEIAAIRASIDSNSRIINGSDTMDQVRQALQEENRTLDRRYGVLDLKINTRREELSKIAAGMKESDRPKALFLSATPFAYHFSLDYAESYLFDHPKENEKTVGGYNHASSRSKFFMENFGYRMRYGKLTQPENATAAGMLERMFSERLKKEGAMRGRALDVPFDYSREFVLTESAIGAKVDEVFNLISNEDKFRVLRDTDAMEIGDYLARRYLLEGIKAREAVSRIKKHQALGRKVVIFHDYKKGGAINPLRLKSFSPEAKLAYDELRDMVPGFDSLVKLLDGLRSPIDVIASAFPDAGIFNGDVSAKNRRKIVEDFNTSGGKMDIVLVQRASGKEGISLHDIDGKHQRVFMDLGIPGRPTDAIQSEGRIFRHGVKSNAVLEYLTTGTDFERWTFAQTIANRASTAENLAMGEKARALLQAFSTGYNDAQPSTPSAEQGSGGKRADRARDNGNPFDNAVALYYTNEKKTNRTKAAEGIDYFATPEPLGFKMVEWANVRPGEKILEPSGGHGAIARFFPDSTIRHAVEPSFELAGRLALNSPDTKIHQTTFENYDIVNKFDAIVMNPPFGTAGKTAMDHLEKAFRHLKDGGRIVALIPNGSSMGKRFDKWYEETEGVFMAGEVMLPSVTFERAGTSVSARVVILDKVKADDARQPAYRDFTDAGNIKDLFAKLKDSTIPERPTPSVQKSPSEMMAELINGGRGAVLPVATENAGDFSPMEFTHTRDGHQVFVAKINRKLDDVEYSAAKAMARRYNGNYSSFRGAGAIPGFHFKSADDRDGFIGTMSERGQSLQAADLSDNETLPNIADLREKGRATMAGPEVEAEIRAQQAAFKQQGKVAGRPDLANISEDEDVRAEMDVTDEMRKWVAERQEKQQWENEGRRLVETDADAVEEKILEAAYTRGGQKFTAADVVAGRILAEKRTKEAGNDKQKHADAAVLRHGYREVRSEQARVLAAGTDPFKTPEERHRDFIAGALYELPQSLLNDIEGRSQSPAQARAAIRKAVIERLTKIEKALKKMGVTLDEITSGQVSLSLAKEKVMKDAIAKLTQAEKLAVAAIQKGGALADIRKLTGLSDAKIQELNARIRRELRDKIKAKVQAGMKLEDLKGKLDGLRAASMLSDEDVEAEIERILAVGFGMPAEVPTVRKSVKRAKPKTVAPIDANWSRPEFTDGLASYTFNDTDRAEIMRKVATLRDLAGVEGKVATLTGDKKAKGVRLIAEINSILSKYDTSVETILREGKDIADYRFDISDRNHVMVVARTINAIDADLLDKGSEYYYASILSGLQTMMVNASTIIPSVLDMTIGRGFEMATNLLFRDPMAASLGEIKYILKAAGPFMARAWTNAAAAWGTEMPFFEEDVLGKAPDLDAIFESRGIYRTGSIGGNLGRIIRTPTRLLLATDEFVRTANACMEVGAMAYRLARREGLTPGTPKFDTFLKQQVNLPGSPAWQLAAKKAADRIFAAPLPGQTDITTGKAVPIRDIGDVVGAGAAQMGKFLNQKTDSLAAKSTLLALRLLFFPFQKVPFNIVRQAARRTLNPISLVDIGVLIGRNLRVIDGKWTLNAKGGKAEIAERLAQQAQGALLVMLLAASGAGEGDDDDLDKPILITGSRPYGETKKGDRELGYRLGLGPYEISMKMPGGKRVGFSYGRLEPAATVLGATVDTMRELAMYRQGKQSLGEAGGKIIGALRSQLTEKTFLRGFSDAQQIASGDSDLSRFTAERLAVVIPNIIRQPLREADPYFRERKDGFVDNLSAALWPYGQGEIKRDLYGDPLEKKGNSASRIIDFTDFGGDQAQPLDEMLWRYRQTHPSDAYAPQSPTANYTDPVTKKPATMTPAQLAKYKEISGQKILALTKRESFNLKNPTESDIKRFKAVVDDGREFARLMLFKSPAWRNLK